MQFENAVLDQLNIMKVYLKKSEEQFLLFSVSQRAQAG